jgi:hypothetical protein
MFKMGLVIRFRPRRRTPFRAARIGDTAAAPCGSELPGRPIAQATVGPILIVLPTQGLEDDDRLAAIREELPVQALVAETAVEALPTGRALSMKAALLRTGATENRLGNGDCRAG